MSLRTRIKGYTAWVNLRLKSYDQLMNNVLMDLLTGTNMKSLLESFTGRELKRLDTMDGLTQQQKITRIEWVVEELKKSKVVPDDLYVDSRMFAMRSADHIFKFLWRLASHDIWFLWERADYLQQFDDEVLSEVPFKWIPEPPPIKKKKFKTKKSLLSGFGASSVVQEKIEDDEPDYSSRYDPFPRTDYMKRFKPHFPDKNKYPSPENIILELVNKHLRMVHEGTKLSCPTLDDLVDSRILCALANSFVPNTFTTEVFLNDRWTINLVLRTTEKMFYTSSPFDSEDLSEADHMSVCAYFCVFFMTAYKYRQAQAVLRRLEQLQQLVRDCQYECDGIPASSTETEDISRKHNLETDIENLKLNLSNLEKKFDIDFLYKWMEHVQLVQKETHQHIRQHIKQRFDSVAVPRNITINDLCLSSAINLTLTNGSGFYKIDAKEQISEGRRIILRDKDRHEYIEDFSSKNKVPVRKILKLPLTDLVEVDPERYPQYEIFFEASSRNKQLRNGSVFLYQVFPGNTSPWQKIFLKAVRENEMETVQRLVVFFRTYPSFINCKEPQTGNSPLHVAARCGHYDVVQYLLENGANMDQKNSYKQTPLFCACEGLQREIAHLLIEWGCDIHVKGPRAQTAFETIKNNEFRNFLIDAYEYYSTIVPKVMEGDTELLKQMIHDHILEIHPLNNLRSRCINGSTLIHTAAYFGRGDLVQDLLNLRVDVNLLDYKGATPLHRAKDVNVMQILMDSGAKPSMEDLEGNTPLHVKCYGESNKPSELVAIKALIAYGAKLRVRNSRGLMPIHCCAMQGRIDAIQTLIEADTDGAMLTELNEEDVKSPPSVIHLAIANDYIDCARWLRSNGFNFKEGEQDVLVRRILTEQIKLAERAEAVQFLLDKGASCNPQYQGGNSALHYAACMSGPTDVLEVLLTNGADLNGTNQEGATALFFACQCNNQYAAAVLMDKGTEVRLKNMQGLTAFDFIMDFDEWIECAYFTDEIKARLKAYSLKHARDLIRAISKKVKPYRMTLIPSQANTQLSMTAPSTGRSRASQHALSGRSSQRSTPAVTFALPPLQRQQGYLTY